MKNLLIIVFLIFACQACKETIIPEESKEEIVAQVNNEKLTLQDFKAFFSDEEWNEMTFENKKTHLNNWIELTVLAQESDKLGLSEIDAIKMRIDSAQKKVKANALIAQKMKEIEPTEDELFNYFKIHKAKYMEKRKEYNMQQITISTLEKLEKVKEEIGNKVKFSEIAEKYSEDNYAKNSGNVGFVSVNDVSEDIWQKLVPLKRFYYTSLEKDNKFIIIRHIDDREISIEMKFISVRDEIRKKLIEEKKRDLVNDYTNKLKKKSELLISI